ncbi:alpha/beta hydrolase [Streptomyces sp. B6B3]|uniref:alpha/beta hydrolase family protein n=1 Tax=Streptomyces sp. B6B3 TaxID=3153570 RepID=UPI00325F660F
MSIRRRSLLGLGAAGAVGLSAGMLRPGQALAGSTPTLPSARQAPTEPFAIGWREYLWTRDGRQLTTHVYYPATGAAGGDPVRDAPIADGVFPVVEFSHGWGGNADSYDAQVEPLAEAGFIVPSPSFPGTGSPQDVYYGNQSKDVSQIITNTLALNDTPGDPFNGHLDTSVGVGASGHSLGGMTTHGLLTAWPDSRIAAAVPIACVDMGTPAPEVSANVLFIHGDQDGTCPYSSARQAYDELPTPKAFLTHLGQGHGEYLYRDAGTYPQTTNTMLDWFRWSLYGDTAARDRLTADATSPGTAWDSALA